MTTDNVKANHSIDYIQTNHLNRMNVMLPLDASTVDLISSFRSTQKFLALTILQEVVHGTLFPTLADVANLHLCFILTVFKKQTIFIYYNHPKSKVKDRMIYSTFKNNLLLLLDKEYQLKIDHKVTLDSFSLNWILFWIWI